jgi:indolepyruvate ferredoxin oxidoreductase, beta subunit
MTSLESHRITNVILTGLGGQGVLTAAEILAEVAFQAGWDVKKTDVHGLSQRGGPVTSDVRFGSRVHSPMVPAGEADFLVVTADEELESHRADLRPGGTLIEPGVLRQIPRPHPRTRNILLLGVLSRHLDFPLESWHRALENNVPPTWLDLNRRALDLGREVGAPLAGERAAGERGASAP